MAPLIVTEIVDARVIEGEENEGGEGGWGGGGGGEGGGGGVMQRFNQQMASESNHNESYQKVHILNITSEE